MARKTRTNYIFLNSLTSKKVEIKAYNYDNALQLLKSLKPKSYNRYGLDKLGNFTGNSPLNTIPTPNIASFNTDRDKPGGTYDLES